MQENLKSATFIALFWSFLERTSYQGVQFIISIVIARILLPEEFGLMAMLTIFIAIGHSFVNSGFGQALIQKQDATYTDECSIFYFNILVAVIFTGVLFFSAPLIAKFYDQPQLTPITKVLSFVFIVNSLGLIQRTLLTKDLDFKTQLKVSLLSTSISGVVAISLALNGFGIWSLVILSFSNELLSTIFLWSLRPWRPSFLFRIEALKLMFGFGSKLFIVSVTNSLFMNIYQLIIGKLFSASDLGYYSRANSLSRYPSMIINSIVGQVSFPLFSKVQDNKEQLRNITQKALKMVTIITFPLMLGIAAVSDPLVKILLTDRWIESVPYLQLLCLVGMLLPIQAINLNALNAQGRSDLHLRVDIIIKFLVVLFLAITYRFGIIAIIYGQIINSFIAYYLYSYYNGKILKYNFLKQIRDIFPSFIVSSIMAVAVFSLNYLPFTSTILLLITQVISGIVLYVCICYIFKIEQFMELLHLTKNILKKE